VDTWRGITALSKDLQFRHADLARQSSADPIHDPVAYVIDGKKYKATGSGGSSDYTRGHHPRGTWVASLITGNNRRTELPIARQTQNGYELLSNVNGDLSTDCANAQ